MKPSEVFARRSGFPGDSVQLYRSSEDALHREKAFATFLYKDWSKLRGTEFDTDVIEKLFIILSDYPIVPASPDCD